LSVAVGLLRKFPPVGPLRRSVGGGGVMRRLEGERGARPDRARSRSLARSRAVTAKSPAGLVAGRSRAASNASRCIVIPSRRRGIPAVRPDEIPHVARDGKGKGRDDE
jgi:ribosomal protein L34E